MNEKALNNQIKQGLLMWLVCITATLVIYLCGKNPLEASMLIVADIIFPIVTLFLFIKKLQISKEDEDIRKRNWIDKLKYHFICQKKGHTVSKIHPKYPSQYCSVCNKHKSQFNENDIIK